MHISADCARGEFAMEPRRGLAHIEKLRLHEAEFIALIRNATNTVLE